MSLKLNSQLITGSMLKDSRNCPQPVCDNLVQKKTTHKASNQMKVSLSQSTVDGCSIFLSLIYQIITECFHVACTMWRGQN